MERLKDPNRPAFQSPWQDVVLVWRVLRVLVARLDLGGIGPLMVRALGLTRGQRRGETVEEYFQAKRELLMEGDAYGDMIAANLAYLERLATPGASDTDGRAGAGAHLARPDHGERPPDRGVGRRHRPRRWGPAAAAVKPGQPASRMVTNTGFPRKRELRPVGGGGHESKPPSVTEAEGEGFLEPAAGQDQGPGAVAETSDQSAATLHPGEEKRSSLGTRRVASAESGTWAFAPGVPPGAAQGGLELRGGKDLMKGPPQCQGGGQPAAREESFCTATVGARARGRKGDGGPASGGGAAEQGGGLRCQRSSRERKGAMGTHPGPAALLLLFVNTTIHYQTLVRRGFQDHLMGVLTSTVIAPNFNTIFTQHIFFSLFFLGDPPIKIHKCMSKIGSFAIQKPKSLFLNGKAAKKI